MRLSSSPGVINITYRIVSVNHIAEVCETGMEYHLAGLLCRSDKLLDTVDFWDDWNDMTDEDTHK